MSVSGAFEKRWICDGRTTPYSDFIKAAGKDTLFGTIGDMGVSPIGRSVDGGISWDKNFVASPVNGLSEASFYRN